MFINLIYSYVYSFDIRCRHSGKTPQTTHSFDIHSCLFLFSGSVPTFKYRLEQVHTVIRHGDRNRIHTLPNYEEVKISSNVTSDIIKQVPEMEDYVRTLKEAARKMPPKNVFSGWALYPKGKFVKEAMLTPIGAAQHVRNGAFLKSVYLRKWKLLGRGSELWDQVQMVTSKTTRTFQSGIALLFGMLPELDMSKLNILPARDNRLCSNNAPIDCSCPAVLKLLNIVSGVYGQWLEGFSKKKSFADSYRTFAETLGVDKAALPLTSHVMDVSTVHMCHRVPLPGPRGGGRCVPPATVGAMIDAINKNGAIHVRNARMQKISGLKMHGLISDIVLNMENIKQGRTKLRFLLFSGHDTTIDSLAVALNISDGLWPRYASRIIIELYSSAPYNSDQRDFFVRVLYDGRDMTHKVGGCSQLAPDNLCRLADFKSYVGEDGLRKRIGGTYLKVCRSVTI